MYIKTTLQTQNHYYIVFKYLILTGSIDAVKLYISMSIDYYGNINMYLIMFDHTLTPIQGRT